MRDMELAWEWARVSLLALLSWIGTALTWVFGGVPSLGLLSGGPTLEAAQQLVGVGVAVLSGVFTFFCIQHMRLKIRIAKKQLTEDDEC